MAGRETVFMMNTTDTRFFAGYTWTSDSADCKLGVCMPGNPAEAARAFILKSPRINRYYNKGKVYPVWTLADANSTPVKHEVEI